MPLRPRPLLPTLYFRRAPCRLPSKITSSTPRVRKLALPAKALTPLAPPPVPRLTSTPTMKLGSISAPKALDGVSPWLSEDGAEPY